MEQLKIYTKDEGEYIELPKADLTVGGEMVYTEVQMAAGNLVQYVQGYRQKITATWDYFPADLLAQLMTQLRSGGWFKVEFPDLDGTDHSGYFRIQPSTMGVFTYDNGKPFWQGLTLSLVARELEG